MAFEFGIRLSKLKDALALMAIDQQVWTSETSPSPVIWHSREQFLRSCPPGSQLVAESDDNLLGYVGYKRPTEMESHRHVYEIHIAVLPEFRQHGVATRLMDALKQTAAEDGIRKLSLRVLATNKPAIAFYESCGFKVQGRLVEEFLLDGRYVDDLLMYYSVLES